LAKQSAPNHAKWQNNLPKQKKAMKIRTIGLLVALSINMAILTGCKKETTKKIAADPFAVDSTKIDAFFNKHPDFNDFKKDVRALYRKHDYRYVWYDTDGRNDFAEVLYNRANQIEVEGVATELPYKKEFASLFSDDRKKPDLQKELLISSMYFFFAQKVYDGLDPHKSRQLGWYLPRAKTSYVDYLDELMSDNDLIKKDEQEMIGLYYNLRKGLKHYRDIRDAGGWETIVWPEGKKVLKIGDNDRAVAQLRRRLYVAGDLADDSGSTLFDRALADGVRNYQAKQNLEPDGKATPSMIKDLNISVEERIRTIIVNMERCRWISPDIYKNSEFIGVNIPSYKLLYIRDGKTALESNVVVGKELNKTVVFSGKLSYLVFSPYWNVPQSIVEKEIEPGLEDDPDYLGKHNMEWNGDQLRQRPGGENSLGLVKFMFPNSNNIYLHDTPAKSLFSKEDRAFSHGCVRVEKARDLAIMLLDDEKGWDADRIDDAMHAGEEKQVPLKRKVPVYIAYFTAQANENGNVSFFDDVYKRDAKLAHFLYSEN
jgi:murein L,D-transpeptidase YcbB/YkuD